MRSEPAKQSPELPPGTRIQPAECDTHGHYDQKIFPVLGKELKSGCPECGRIIHEKADAAELANKAMELRMSMERKLGAALIPYREIDRKPLTKLTVYSYSICIRHRHELQHLGSNR